MPYSIIMYYACMYICMYVEPMPYHTSTYTGHKSNAAKFIELNSSKHERKKRQLKNVLNLMRVATNMNMSMCMQHATCGTGQQRSWTEIILENCKLLLYIFFNCFSRVFYVMAMKNYLNIFLCAPCETLFVYFSCFFFFIQLTMQTFAF